MLLSLFLSGTCPYFPLYALLLATPGSTGHASFDWFAFGMDLVKSILGGFMVGVGVLAAQWYAKKVSLRKRIQLVGPHASEPAKLVKREKGWELYGGLTFRVECLEATPDCPAGASVDLCRGGQWARLGEANLRGKPMQTDDRWGLRIATTVAAISIAGHSSRAVRVGYCCGVTDQGILDDIKEKKNAVLRIVCRFVSVGTRATEPFNTDVEVQQISPVV